MLNCPDTPQDLGLPEKFQEWRPNQAEGVELSCNSEKRVVAICAPTGFGKELLCVSTARLSAVPTCIVTDSRGLQDQYLRTYKDIGIADLRGRRNYVCSMKDDENYTCEDGYNARCPYKGTIMCPSSQAEMRAATSHLVLTNYDKWTSSKKYGQGLNHIQQVIFDEGHTLPDALARAMQVVLHHKEIEETLGIDFLGGSAADDMRCWKSWAAAARGESETAMIAARQKISGAKDPKSSWVRHFTHMRNLARRLATISTAPAKDWIVEQIDEGFQFDPIRPGKYAESTLLLKVPKIVVVSATIRPKTLYMSGIGKDNFIFHEFASSFDPYRCPIYWVPTMKVKGMNQDLSMLWLRLDQIIAKRRGLNGIVHTISYDRQQQILNASRFADNMLINKRGEPPTEMVEYFKSVPNTGTILVSPSIGTGYDFPHDSCRFQFVCKIPFEPPSKILKARQEADKEYTYYRAMQYLVQAFGRDMREDSDWSERFIADDQMEWFMPRYSHLAPKSFNALFRKVDILPQPLKV